MGGVRLRVADGGEVPGAALVGADGLHSGVRTQLLGDGGPREIGDVAYRTLLHTAQIPAAARANQVLPELRPSFVVAANIGIRMTPFRGGLLGRDDVHDGWCSGVDSGRGFGRSGQAAGNIMDPFFDLGKNRL